MDQREDLFFRFLLIIPVSYEMMMTALVWVAFAATQLVDDGAFVDADDEVLLANVD